MNDKTKLKLIIQLIDNYYEFFSCSDGTKDSAHMASTIDAIFTIAWFGEEGKDDCQCVKHGSECSNCIE